MSTTKTTSKEKEGIKSSSTENKKNVTTQDNTNNNSQKSSNEGKQYFSDILPKTGEQKTILAFMGLLVLGGSWLIFRRKD